MKRSRLTVLFLARIFTRFSHPALRRAGATAMLIIAGFTWIGMDIIPHKDALGTLKELGESEADKEKALAAQEASFQKVTEALVSDKLSVGSSMQMVRRQVGEPVAKGALPEKSEKWLYRSRHGSAMKASWIFMYFDSRKDLVKWECARVDCGEVPSVSAEETA